MVLRMYDITRLTGWQSAIQIARGCESCWLKTHELGRGPAYETPLDLDVARTTPVKHIRRIDRMLEAEQKFSVDSESKLLVLSSSERAHFAIGLLTVESDMEHLSLKDMPWRRAEGIES